ncbi:MAG: LysE family transporter [Candidatus Bathyarchaeia archaeon]
MLDFLWLFSLSIAAALSGAVVPGPVFVVVVSESLKKGKITGPLVVFGHLAIETLVIFMFFLGLGIVLKSSQITIMIGYIGGAILVLMGFYHIKTAKNFKIESVSESKAQFARHGLVAAGFLSSGSNPQFFLWWLTTGVPMITYSLAIAGVVGFIVFYLGHAAADLLWYGFISYSVDKGRTYLNQRAVRIILLGSATFLIAFGLYLVFSAYVI